MYSIYRDYMSDALLIYSTDIGTWRLGITFIQWLSSVTWVVQPEEVATPPRAWLKPLILCALHPSCFVAFGCSSTPYQDIIDSLLANCDTRAQKGSSIIPDHPAVAVIPCSHVQAAAGI